MSPRALPLAVVALLLAPLACDRAPPATTTADAKTEAKTDANADAKSDANVDAKAPDARGCKSWADLDPTTLPALPQSAFATTLDEVWRRVLEKHYDPTLACRDWPALREKYGQALVGIDDRAAAYAKINELLDELGQSHFRLFPPQRADDDQPIGSALPRMQVRWIEDRLVVVQSEAKGKTGAVPTGAVLLSVEDQALTATIERVKGRTERPSEFAFEIARATQARLSCERAGDRRRVEIADPARGDKTVVRTLTCEEPEGELVTLGNLENLPTRVEHRMIAGTKLGYLAFNIWMLPMAQRVEAAMADLRKQGMTGLVLDLRGNPGGVGAMSMPIARLLLREKGSLGKLRFREFEQEFKVEGNGDAFTGPVALLVDEGTASTSEIFAVGLRDLGRVTIVGGRASAGAALPSVIEELTGGAVLQYVVGDYQSPKGTVVEGTGVVPDVLVPETRADFAAGRDPVLDAAIQHLQKG
jgi:carboxyl-terminal processing protease